MKANELRIGNWGIDVKNKTNVQVTAFDFPHLFSNPDAIAPISLTPEILKKCNIEECDEGLCVKKGGIILYNKYEGYIEPIYVHQLQNLYFALTGEELNIEL